MCGQNTVGSKGILFPVVLTLTSSHVETGDNLKVSDFCLFFIMYLFLLWDCSLLCVSRRSLVECMQVFLGQVKIWRYWYCWGIPPVYCLCWPFTFLYDRPYFFLELFPFFYTFGWNSFSCICTLKWFYMALYGCARLHNKDNIPFTTHYR